MIACYCESIEDEKISLDGEQYNHLVGSLRVKEGDYILALDGRGKKRILKVNEIRKKELLLSGGVVEVVPRNFEIDILISPPKRESMNDCIRAACEIGIRKIFIYFSEYCQNRKIDEKRLSKIINSSLIQSNNPYSPEIIIINDDIEQLRNMYEKVVVFHPSGNKLGELNSSGRILMVIGPEGGFSDEDLSDLKRIDEKCSLISLPTPILRAHTALCVGAGYLISKI